jgi:hypothetical protein
VGSPTAASNSTPVLARWPRDQSLLRAFAFDGSLGAFKCNDDGESQKS